MAEANDRQVGGSHYKAGDLPQHWDLAVMYGWDPFQYQITKYIMRWKSKHDTPAKRRQDVEKAKHFIEKYLEVLDKYDPSREPVKELPSSLQEYESQSPRYISNANFLCEGGWGDGMNLYTCLHCREQVKAASLTDIIHECGGPTGGYVNQ